MSVWRSKTYDLLAAAPFIGLYALGSWGLWMQATAAIRAAIVAGGALRMLDAASLVASLTFVAFQIVLFVVRRAPVQFSSGWLDRGTAAVAASLPAALLLLPRYAMPPIVHGISGTLIAAGTVGSIWTLRYLGRAYSIFPQARRLETGGPYRLIRHPLYLFEIVGLLGVMLQFEQPQAAVVVAGTILLQLWRMRFEERVLTRAFPEYSVYANRTARLIPRVY